MEINRELGYPEADSGLRSLPAIGRRGQGTTSRHGVGRLKFDFHSGSRVSSRRTESTPPAANEKESSFGTYCDEDAVVNGTNYIRDEPASADGEISHRLIPTQVPRRPLLGVLLEDADSAFPRVAQRQMAKVVKETKESHVQIWRHSFASDFAGAFEGDANKHGYLAATPRPRSARRRRARRRCRTTAPRPRPACPARASVPPNWPSALRRRRALSPSRRRTAAVSARASPRRGFVHDATWACCCGGRRAPVVPPRHLDEFVLGHVGMLGALCADGVPDAAASVRSACA